MAEPLHGRLPSAHYDALLIKTSQEAIQRSRALLERTRPPVVAQPTDPLLAQARNSQPK